MATQRTKRIWNESGQRGATAEVDPSPEAQRERALYAKDYKLFYRECLAKGVKDRLGRNYADLLGPIHDLLIDFLNLELPDVTRYTELYKLLPPKDAEGNFSERWFYWRTLDTPPTIQDGPDGDIAAMFHGRFWHGVVIRIAGDGLTKCLLAPRGHLKSTICTQGYTQWRICRDPQERHLIETVNAPLAIAFVRSIKWQFDANAALRRHYCDLVPAKREAQWNDSAIQLRTEARGVLRRGPQPTVEAKGLGSETTGCHYDFMTFDDIVAKSNYRNQGPVIAAVQEIQGVIDPGAGIRDIGTRWEDNDAHKLFIDKNSDQYSDTCFLVATALDDDKTAKCSKRLTPLGYGKPIWPQKFSTKELEKKRRGMMDDRLWFGQYFNQFHGTSLRVFNKNWIHYYEGVPEEVVVAQNLNVFIGVDTASGAEKEKNRKLDFTSAFVLGQTQDRLTYYVLDAFCERLNASMIARAIVDTVMHWKEIIYPRPGCRLCVGVEETAYTTYVGPMLEMIQREMGLAGQFHPTPLKHNNQAKIDRVRLLAQPYSETRVLWPRSLVRPSYVMTQPQKGPPVIARQGEPYDVLELLENQFLLYPSIEYDDLLDAHAWAFEQAPLREFVAESQQETQTRSGPGRYVRGEAEEKRGQLAAGGYEYGVANE